MKKIIVILVSALLFGCHFGEVTAQTVSKEKISKECQKFLNPNVINKLYPLATANGGSFLFIENLCINFEDSLVAFTYHNYFLGGDTVVVVNRSGQLSIFIIDEFGYFLSPISDGLSNILGAEAEKSNKKFLAFYPIEGEVVFIDENRKFCSLPFLEIKDPLAKDILKDLLATKRKLENTLKKF
jgi:hypothetical protein